MAAIMIRRRWVLAVMLLLCIAIITFIIIYYTSFHLFLPSATIRIVNPLSDVRLKESMSVKSINDSDPDLSHLDTGDGHPHKLVQRGGRKILAASRENISIKPQKPPSGKYKEMIYPHDPYHGRCYNWPASKQVTHPLTATEIAKSLSRKFEISERTLQDIREAVELNVISINRSHVDDIKIVLGFHGYEHSPHYTWYNFSHCEYTNCIPLNPHRSLSHPMAPDAVTKAASIILFNVVEMHEGSTLRKIPRRPDQYFGVTSLESTGYSYNHLSPNVNGLINFTATYSRKSTVPEWHIFKACMDKREKTIPPVNYAQGKTKGALAYVSNCMSMQYNRLSMMKALSEYVPVDIYGMCGSSDPCPRDGNGADCRKKLHQQYYFYLSFENSLCEDYISEKFWDRLSDENYMLPVAMGGLRVEEYTQQSPEQSFLHVRNFTSIKALGTFMKGLMENEDAYNSYHRWRESWHVYKRPIYTRFPSCDLCRIANERPLMPADPHLSDKYNDGSHCSNYNWH